MFLSPFSGPPLSSPPASQPALTAETVPESMNDTAEIASSPAEKSIDAPPAAPAEIPADLSEVIERCRAQKPGVAGHLMACDCTVSADGRRITVLTDGAFAQSMLSRPENLAVLTSVFRLCGIGEPGASVNITTGAKPKQKKAVDELADY